MSSFVFSATKHLLWTTALTSRLTVVSLPRSESIFRLRESTLKVRRSLLGVGVSMAEIGRFRGCGLS
jgi:hypothetical protein